MTTKYRIADGVEATACSSDWVNLCQGPLHARVFSSMLTPLEEDDPDTVRVSKDDIEVAANTMDEAADLFARQNCWDEDMAGRLRAARTILRSLLPPEPEKDWLDGEEFSCLAIEDHQVDAERKKTWSAIKQAIRAAVARGEIGPPREGD